MAAKLQIEYHNSREVGVDGAIKCTCTPALGFRHYTINGQRVYSVSQAVGIIDKSGPLQGYAARCVREGVIELIGRKGWRPWKDEKALNGSLYRAGLNYSQRTSDAAERGKAIHKLVEFWASEHKLPSTEGLPVEWHGWVRALARFLRECQPEYVETEQAVGSARYGVAGRRDAVVMVDKPRGQFVRVGRGLIDYKTSKSIYPTQFLQIAGYELLGRECGLEPTDWQAIIQLSDNGTYRVGYSTATAADFVAALDCFKATREVEERWKKVQADPDLTPQPS